MDGGNKLVTVTLRNPRNKEDRMQYYIRPLDNALSLDWQQALKKLLSNGSMLEKNYCFLGFAKTQRDLDYLCRELNQAVEKINQFNYSGIWQNHGLDPYFIEEYFTPDVVRYGEEYLAYSGLGGDDRNNKGLQIKHGVMNRLHNHFEILQGTVTGLSQYYLMADDETKYAIRQLNNLCHETENLILSIRKARTIPEWQRPSQITTWLGAPRYLLRDEHRQLFCTNGYDRCFGTVYMHWCQIGKTLFEVWRDEGAPDLTVGDTPENIMFDTGATCEAITALQYYSGEFDIEWGQDIRWDKHEWWREFLGRYYTWLDKNKIDRNNPRLSLGYLPIAQVDLLQSFGTKDPQQIWDLLSNYLDIYSIEFDGVVTVYDSVWSDPDFADKQIQTLKVGYQHQKDIL